MSCRENEVKGLTIIERDRIGLLADVTSVLGDNGINIESISVDATQDGKSIIRVITNNCKKAKEVLFDKGFRALDAELLVLKIPDRPGETAKISRLLANKKIVVKNIYVMNKGWRGEAVYAFNTSDNSKAKTLLKNYL